MIRLFEYINKPEIFNKMGLSEYFNCYKDNIKTLFNLASEPKRKTKNIFNKDEKDNIDKDINSDEEGDNDEEKEKNQIITEEQEINSIKILNEDIENNSNLNDEQNRNNNNDGIK